MMIIDAALSRDAVHLAYAVLRACGAHNEHVCLLLRARVADAANARCRAHLIGMTALDMTPRKQRKRHAPLRMCCGDLLYATRCRLATNARMNAVNIFGYVARTGMVAIAPLIAHIVALINIARTLYNSHMHISAWDVAP